MVIAAWLHMEFKNVGVVRSRNKPRQASHGKKCWHLSDGASPANELGSMYGKVSLIPFLITRDDDTFVCVLAIGHNLVSSSSLHIRSIGDLGCGGQFMRVLIEYAVSDGNSGYYEIERDGQPSEGDGKQKTYRLDRMSNAEVLDESVDQHEYIDESIDASIRRSGSSITLLFGNKQIFEDRDWPEILSSEEVLEGSDSGDATDSSLLEDARGPRVRAVVAVENESWFFDQLLSCNCSIVIDPADRSDYAEAFCGRFKAYVEALLG